MEDLYRAGGVSAVMGEMAEIDCLDLSAVTITGEKLGGLVSGVHSSNPDVIRDAHTPFMPSGGLAVLWGSLAPDGSVVKESAVSPDVLRHR